VFYFLSSTINPILYSVMSKRFRRAFRDKLCRYRSCCLCLSCGDGVIAGGAASAAPQGPARIRPGDSQSTTTRQRLLQTYGKNPHLTASSKRPVKEISFAAGKKWESQDFPLPPPYKEKGLLCQEYGNFIRNGRQCGAGVPLGQTPARLRPLIRQAFEQRKLRRGRKKV